MQHLTITETNTNIMSAGVTNHSNMDNVQPVHNSAIIQSPKNTPADLNMILVEKYELSIFLKTQFEQTGKAAIELKEVGLYDAYRNVVLIANSEGKKGTISDKSLIKLADYLGFTFTSRTTYIIKEKP